MSVVEISPGSGHVYKKLPLTKKERQKLVATYRKAPLIQKKSEQERQKKTAEAEQMLGSLFISKNSSPKKTD